MHVSDFKNFLKNYTLDFAESRESERRIEGKRMGRQYMKARGTVR
jgi:hypothetical protein